jgi:phospholipase/carboxylesterase
LTSEIQYYLSAEIEHWDGKSPIVVLMHGYGSNEEDLTDLMSYLPGNLPWVSLQAPLELSFGSYAWFPLTSLGMPNAEHVLEATEDIWRWIDQNLPETARLIAMGFSQGGLMASQLLRTRPERIAGTVILSGFTLAEAQPLDTQIADARPRVIYTRGLNDQVISEATADRTETWIRSHTNATVCAYEDLGHSVDQRVLDDVAKYLLEILPS